MSDPTQADWDERAIANGVMKKPTAAERIAAVEAKRAARRAAISEPKLEQEADDLEAFDALESVHGEGKVIKLPLPYYTKGLPTLVAVCAPEEQYVKRMRQMIRAAPKNSGAAQDMLASSPGVVAYPSAEVYEKVKAQYGAIHDSVGNAAVKLSQARATEEGND